jgi:hypothetical protein
MLGFGLLLPALEEPFSLPVSHGRLDIDNVCHTLAAADTGRLDNREVVEMNRQLMILAVIIGIAILYLYTKPSATIYFGPNDKEGTISESNGVITVACDFVNNNAVHHCYIFDNMFLPSMYNPNNKDCNSFLEKGWELKSINGYTDIDHTVGYESLIFGRIMFNINTEFNMVICKQGDWTSPDTYIYVSGTSPTITATYLKASSTTTTTTIPGCLSNPTCPWWQQLIEYFKFIFNSIVNLIRGWLKI